MSQETCDQAEFLREVAARLRAGRPFDGSDGGPITLSSLHYACDKLERMARDLERVPKEPLLVKLADGCTLKTQEATFFEDLPWDAYVHDKNGSTLAWADGMTEIEAIKKVLRLHAAAWV